MTDQFFVSIQDGQRTSLLLGPFTNETDCRKFAYSEAEEGGNVILHNSVYDAVMEIDRRAHFMCWGMLRIKDVKPEENLRGVLNRVYPEKWDKVIS